MDPLEAAYQRLRLKCNQPPALKPRKGYIPHPRPKRFTAEQIREMRKLRANGMRYWRIGVKFGCSKGMIWQIANRNIYKWVK